MPEAMSCLKGIASSAAASRLGHTVRLEMKNSVASQSMRTEEGMLDRNRKAAPLPRKSSRIGTAVRNAAIDRMGFRLQEVSVLLRCQHSDGEPMFIRWDM
jgi:hypothetical protein